MPKSDWNARTTTGYGRPARTPPKEALLEPDDGRAGGSAKRGSASPRQGGRPKAASAELKSAKRFIEPYPFTAAEHEAIGKALADAGLGDATAREIFIGAIAYDLAVLADVLARRAPAGPGSTDAASGKPAPSAAPEPALRAAASQQPALVQPARALIDALGGLDDAERSRLLAALCAGDPYRRDYGPAYLDALVTELTRVADAAGTPAPSSATGPPPRRKPRPQPGSRPEQRQTTVTAAPNASAETSAVAFLRHAAKVYEQCFDAKPEPAASKAFAKTLTALAEATGIAIPRNGELLRRALDAS
jgi:hypothetical protein